MPEGEVRGNVEHGEGGKFQDKYSDDEVLDALIQAHPEPLTNKDVKERIGCSKATAHNRLHELNGEGKIETKMAGARARVWWVDLNRPAREIDTVQERLEALGRDALMRVASRFEPDFNPTRTSTADVREFLLDQSYADLERALTQEVPADGE